ncbi:MAG: hypothetical protein JWN77_3128 [Frankiales bacterium]|nr:hypothetical protein [Frankiales bacterium]
MTGRLRPALPTDPLTRNGYALVLSTLVTGALGVVYWVVAARLFDARELGLDAAALTAMTLVASVAGMNLSGALVFVLPRLGPSAGSYIWRYYRWAGTGALALGAVAALGSTLLDDARDFLGGSPSLAVLFVIACLGWVLFTVQDGALTGLQRGDWVLAENSAFSVAKLLLLIVAARLGLSHGVLLSWVLPVLVLVPLLNLLIAHTVLPAIAGRPEAVDELGLRRFLGINYASALVYQAYVHLLPLLVLLELGAEANGLFYVAWTWSTAIDLLSHALGSSLTAEGSAAPEQLPVHLRRTATRLALLVGPGVAALVTVAPVLLSVYGDGYDASVDVLRLLSLGALPRCIVILAQSTSRARGRAGLLLWSEVAICCITLGLTLLLLPSHGATAVGISWLVGNTVVAALLLPGLRREAAQA